MSANGTRPGTEALGLPPRFATSGVSLRDKLAIRLHRMDVEAPEALDLLAAILEAVSCELRGVAGLVAGPKGADHFRRVLRGEEAGIAEEVARLALGPWKEGRMAARAFARVLAAATETESALGDAHEAVATATELAGKLSAEAQRALADDVVTVEEAHSLADGIERLESYLRSLKGAAARIEASAARKPVSA